MRRLFRQNRMYPASPQQALEQQWFPGVHSDVGGGYPEADGGLWREPFLWMVAGATKQGMLVDAMREREVLNVTPAAALPCADGQHESLTLPWWPAEFFPKWQWRSAQQRNVLAVGLGRHRRIEEAELIHKCALERIRHRTGYRPKNLSDAFVRTVLALATTPDAMPYSTDLAVESSMAERT